MDSLDYISLPLSGMGDAVRSFSFKIDNQFFKTYNEDAQLKGKFNVEVVCDKRPGILTLDFAIKGFTDTSCDRCLVNIALPIKSTYQLLVKYGDETSLNDEVLTISSKTEKLLLASHIYDYILLSIPHAKVYACDEEENPPCDLGILKHLGSKDENIPEAKDSLWDELKKFSKEK